MKNNIFSFLPIEAAMDGRLTLTELRVLVALFSFQGENISLDSSSKQKISERTPGYSSDTISSAIIGLIEKGWIMRQQNKEGTMIEITCPEEF
jgi:hypothetical protein